MNSDLLVEYPVQYDEESVAKCVVNSLSSVSIHELVSLSKNENH